MGLPWRSPGLLVVAVLSAALPCVLCALDGDTMMRVARTSNRVPMEFVTTPDGHLRLADCVFRVDTEWFHVDLRPGKHKCDRNAIKNRALWMPSPFVLRGANTRCIRNDLNFLHRLDLARNVSK